MTRTRTLFWPVGLAYFGTWIFISWLSAPSFDGYGDMVENYAWSQTWALGTFKHPPLLAWTVGSWFAIFPTEVLPYYVLSYVNAGLGVLGIVCLARLWLPATIPAGRRDVFVMLVLVFAVLSTPYSNLAAKFNADTILLSSWPWTAYAFFAALHAVHTREKWLFTVLLAVMGAAAMLGKYYSALLLASLFVISVSIREYRRWYGTLYPYAALAIFVGLLLPHVMWERRVGFPFQSYLVTRIDPDISVWRILLFWLSGIYYLALSWLAFLIVRRRLAVARPQPVSWAISLRALLLLCTLPALMTAAFNLIARVHLTTHWAIPVWFGLPVLMAVWLLPQVGEDFEWRTFSKGLAIFWIALLTGAVIYTIGLSVSGNAKYALARQEMVRAIEARFAGRFPGQQLSWVGGSWPETGALAFFGTNHPRALPGFPDEMRALVNPYPAWSEKYGVILCYASGAYARNGSRDTECETQTRAWLQRRNLPLEEETLNYQAGGWRYRRPDPKNVTVFWIAPAARGETKDMLGFIYGRLYRS